MSPHPSIDELFTAASADRVPADIAAHAEGCADCRRRLARLAEGARLLDEARSAPTHVHWEAIDAAVEAEAERMAESIRAGEHRVVRPWQFLGSRWAVGSLALAAAAAGLLALQNRPRVAETPETVALRPVAVTPAAVVAARWEGEVLLSAGGARWRDGRDAVGAQPLGVVTALREGGHLAAGARGRGVVTVQPGWTLDVRPGASVDLARMRVGEATVAVNEGTVALRPDGSAAQDARVDLRAGHWTIASSGPVTAQVTTGIVRVVVLGSSVSVQRDDAAAVRFSGPVVLDLPDVGTEARVANQPARDPDALDLSMLSGAGRLWTLPLIDPAATLSVAGHGALPSGLEALRLDAPVTVRARLGQMLMTLEVGSGRPMEWIRAPRAVASALPGANHAVQPAPTAIPVAVPAAPPSTAMRAIEAQVRARVSHCFVTCRERNMCPGELHGQVVLTLTDQGRVSAVTVDPSARGAETCVRNEAQSVYIPGGLDEFRLPIH